MPVDFSVDDPGTDVQMPASMSQAMPAPMASPGMAVIGTNQVPVGIQAPQTVQEYQAWQSRQPNQSVQDANRIAEQQALEETQYRQMLEQNARVQGAAKAVETARKFQAMRRYENDLKMGVSAGLSESQAALHAATRNPEAFGSSIGSAVTAFNRASQPVPAAPPLGEVTFSKDPVTGQVVSTNIREGAGSIKVMPVSKIKTPGSLNDIQKAELKVVDAQEKLVHEGLKNAAGDPLAEGQASRRLLQLDGQRNAILQRNNASPPAAAPVAPAAPLPMPKSKSELVKDSTYQTSKGIARWTGEHFERIQ